MVGTTVDLIAAWLVSFTSPYIMNEPYGGIGGNIGYIFGGIAALGLVFAILVVPELKVSAVRRDPQCHGSHFLGTCARGGR